eukprot:7446196-Pyramimonas_sp.AAC.1
MGRCDSCSIVYFPLLLFPPFSPSRPPPLAPPPAVHRPARSDELRGGRPALQAVSDGGSFTRMAVRGVARMWRADSVGEEDDDDIDDDGGDDDEDA